MSEASDKTRTPHVGSTDERVKSAGMRNLDIGLILLSGVCFFVMLSIPWMPLSVTQKAMLGGGLFVTVQVSWWVGAAILGPAAIKKISSWFSSKKREDLAEQDSID